jgi:hypothetical protein
VRAELDVVDVVLLLPHRLAALTVACFTSAISHHSHLVLHNSKMSSSPLKIGTPTMNDWPACCLGEDEEET